MKTLIILLSMCASTIAAAGDRTCIRLTTEHNDGTYGRLFTFEVEAAIEAAAELELDDESTLTMKLVTLDSEHQGEIVKVGYAVVLTQQVYVEALGQAVEVHISDKIGMIGIGVFDQGVADVVSEVAAQYGGDPRTCAARRSAHGEP